MSSLLGPFVILLACVAAGAAVFSAVMAMEGVSALRAQRRLAKLIADSGIRPEELSGKPVAMLSIASPILRVLLKYGRRFGQLRGVRRLVSAYSSPERVTEIRRLLERAGYSDALAVQDVVGAKFLAGLVLGLVYLPRLLKGNLSAVIFMAVLFLAGFILPDFLLKRAVTSRQQEVRRALPRATDIMVVAVEAGLHFNKAIELYCERFEGPLADEFERVLEEMRIGRRRREALTDAAARLNLDEFNLLVSAIMQAERFGTPMGQVLRSLSRELKIRREQWVREESSKAPVKMLFPLVFLILPALFCVLLGPMVVRIITQGGLF